MAKQIIYNNQIKKTAANSNENNSNQIIVLSYSNDVNYAKHPNLII